MAENEKGGGFLGSLKKVGSKLGVFEEVGDETPTSPSTQDQPAGTTREETGPKVVSSPRRTLPGVNRRDPLAGNEMAQELFGELMKTESDFSGFMEIVSSLRDADASTSEASAFKSAFTVLKMRKKGLTSKQLVAAVESHVDALKKHMDTVQTDFETKKAEKIGGLEAELKEIGESSEKAAQQIEELQAEIEKLRAREEDLRAQHGEATQAFEEREASITDAAQAVSEQFKIISQKIITHLSSTSATKKGDE